MPLQVIFVLLIALAPLSMAQMRSGDMGHGIPGLGHAVGFTGHHQGAFARHLAYFGNPFFYSDYPSGSLAYAAPAPPVVIVQPAAAVAAEPEAKPQPLMIERQGDRYVRVSNDGASATLAGRAADARSPARAAATSPLSSAAPSATGLRPAVLVFRDGHREEVLNYVIAGGLLYTRDDYWQSGSWRRDIQLSALDLPATLRANQDHGVKFVLPSGPNEVVTRP